MRAVIPPDLILKILNFLLFYSVFHEKYYTTFPDINGLYIAYTHVIQKYASRQLLYPYADETNELSLRILPLIKKWKDKAECLHL